MNEARKERTGMREEQDVDELTFICGSIIGTFTAGKKTGGRKFWVYVCGHARGVPHFHVYDKDGDPVEGNGKGGVHACVELRKNLYCTHGPGTGVLDREVRAALARFMREVRKEGKYCSDVGSTNFFHAAAAWDENNAMERRSNWVDPEMAPPDYRTIDDIPDRSWQGLPACVRTFAIMSAENPMGKRSPPTENETRNRQLVADLKAMHFPYYPIRGSYNRNPENPFVIFNIGLDDAKYLNHKYDQEAFILADVLNAEKAKFRYYQKRFGAQDMANRGWKPPCPEVADYTLRVTSQEVILPNTKDGENGYSAIFRKFTYSIPFSIFQEFNEKLEKRCTLFKDYEECLNARIQLGIDGGGARNRMHYRASIYGDQFRRFWNVVR